eukprot:6193717-Pleurochrysis_carterae.AAC.1
MLALHRVTSSAHALRADAPTLAHVRVHAPSRPGASRNVQLTRHTYTFVQIGAWDSECVYEHEGGLLEQKQARASNMHALMFSRCSTFNSVTPRRSGQKAI